MKCDVDNEKIQMQFITDEMMTKWKKMQKKMKKMKLKNAGKRTEMNHLHRLKKYRNQRNLIITHVKCWEKEWLDWARNGWWWANERSISNQTNKRKAKNMDRFRIAIKIDLGKSSRWWWNRLMTRPMRIVVTQSFTICSYWWVRSGHVEWSKARDHIRKVTFKVENKMVGINPNGMWVNA